MGNPYRGDDGVGPAVARRVATLLERVPAARDDRARHRAVPTVQVLAGVADPLDLVGRWDDAALAIVLDAARSGGPVGSVTVVEGAGLAGSADATPTAHDPGDPGLTSTHGLGIVAVIRLARAMGNAPRRVVLVTVTGADFRRSDALSPAVAAAVEHAASLVLGLLVDRVPASPGPPGPW